MANTYRTYEGDGSQTTWAIPVSDWISDSHIIVQLDADGERYDVDRSGAYSFSISGSDIVFDVAPADGVKFTVMRDTLGKDYDDTALDYDFNDGSVVTADQLDGVYRHALYLAQEAADLAFRKAALTDNSVLAYDSSSSQWEALPLGLVYDSTNDTFGFGGTSQSDYKFRFNGDTLIKEDGTSNGAVLTIENTDVTNQQATLIVAASTPQVQFKDSNGDTDKKYFLHTYQNGVYQLVAQDDAGNAKSIIPLRLQEDGKTVLGGTSSQNADAGYQHTFYGDVLMHDTDAGNECILKIQTEGTDADDLAAIILEGTSSTIIFKDNDAPTDKGRAHIGIDNNYLNFAVYNNEGNTLYGVPLQIGTGSNPAAANNSSGEKHNVLLTDLPTSDPGVTNAIWNRGGHLAVSGQLPAIYDSGWGTSLAGTSLAANTSMGIIIDEDLYNNLVFRNVQVFARSSSSATNQFMPISTSFIVEETSGGTQFSVGVKWSAAAVGGIYYIYIETGDYATLESDAPSFYEWVTHLDEIRVTIT
jgi:hypothetical protein